jgi:hypothetical protein
MNEIWKDIEGYDGAYQVSNMGRVKSVARVTTRLCQYGIREYRIPERIMRTRFGTSGYLCVNLHHEGKQVTEMIHRLVALHFCKGYADGMTVNHIDEVKTNNRADNLEWLTQKENNNHGTGIARRKKHPKAVVQMSLSGEVLQTFPSLKAAAKAVGQNPTHLGHCCNGERPTAAGFKWKFIQTQ